MRYSLDSFEILKDIGKGAFGKISLVREIKTKEIYAMKQQSKSYLIEQDQIENIKAEREFLAKVDNDWIIKVRSNKSWKNCFFVL